jgi:type III pantothenate kinase
VNLIIDIGNTVAKVALFDRTSMVEVVYDSNQSLDSLEAVCNKYDVRKAIVATVIDLNECVLAQLNKLPVPVLWLDSHTPLPVINLYETPETLGYDRMAAVVAAHDQFPGKDILVIDAGTCITYEFVDSLGQYFARTLDAAESTPSIYRTFAVGSCRRTHAGYGKRY